MSLETQTITEFARFFVQQPTFEQMTAFHYSSEVVERASELIRIERDGLLTEDERKDLHGYRFIEDILELIKLEAARQLEQQQP